MQVVPTSCNFKGEVGKKCSSVPCIPLTRNSELGALVLSCQNWPLHQRQHSRPTRPNPENCQRHCLAFSMNHMTSPKPPSGIPVRRRRVQLQKSVASEGPASTPPFFYPTWSQQLLLRAPSFAANTESTQGIPPWPGGGEKGKEQNLQAPSLPGRAATGPPRWSWGRPEGTHNVPDQNIGAHGSK